MADPRAVEALKTALRRLPGVGPKSAQRMAFHLLRRDRDGARQIGAAIARALSDINHCARCNNFCEASKCAICASPKRDATQLCIVETPADLQAIEQAGVYQGMYFVLMGHLSPLDDIGPSQLGIDRLLELTKTDAVAEIILATNLTVEGQATADFIIDLMQPSGIRVTRLARGMPMGGELEYMDSGTLNQAFSDRREV
ncbi:MAG: recombination mediator RecR [Gammaproteobacteria bacterium]|nr:recombination mediator RecR [Gammaproteobacteria bacterium]MDD9821444.1 recombination mediator RecR [Gammaproteobacteria bacterium]MDD9855907.1 recombination mediator RecR [Gammaproteobacteria bacterium]MDD9883843.1 recombination mediator RecR [Gammaproteobacteria bacterium]